MHGNSKQNKDSQHLYEIRDKETDDIFKYGISAGAFGADGLRHFYLNLIKNRK